MLAAPGAPFRALLFALLAARHERLFSDVVVDKTAPHVTVRRAAAAWEGEHGL
jgi:hypothetical protein